MVFLRSSCHRVSGHRRGAALELMKRMQPEPQMARMLERTLVLQFFSQPTPKAANLCCRIPKWADGAHFLRGALSSRLMKEELGLGHRGDTRLSLANCTESELQGNLTQSPLAPWHDAAGGGCGTLSPRHIVQFPCHVYKTLCADAAARC